MIDAAAEGTVVVVTRFPPGFFDRADESPDPDFYTFDRLVTHIDDGAIAAVGALYAELGLTGDVLDLCSSWISHFERRPARLVALGMNPNELACNEAATDTLVHDLNENPTLPFDEATFDAVTCCVSIDYLTRPVEVLAEAARVLRPGGTVVITFSNRCFPTKAISAWLGADDRGRCRIVATYLAAIDRLAPPTIQLRNPGARGDPLHAVWSRTWPNALCIRPATAADQAFITDMQFDALFSPPGAAPFDRSILDVADINRYHAGFATRPGDVGRIAMDADGSPVGAVWARRVEGYGFVDRDTPELGIAVVAGHRGCGIGSALLGSLLAAEPRLSLSVDSRNPAIRLYERSGFVRRRTDGEHTVVMLREAP